MKKADIKIGSVYVAKISNVLTKVRIESLALHGKGWRATNIRTGREVHIKSAAKLRKEVTSD